jgi:hypothetical protein
MGYNYLLERKVKQRLQGGKYTFFVPRCPPDAQVAVPLGQRVSKNQHALLGQPKRCLVAAAPVIQGNEIAGKLAARFDRLEVGLRNFIAPKEAWAERPSSVATYEEIDVADVIRFEDDGKSWRLGVESLPQGICVVGRRDWV